LRDGCVDDAPVPVVLERPIETSAGLSSIINFTMTQSRIGRTGHVHLLAAVLAAAACVVAPGRALAASVIDAAIKPYFVLGGFMAALVFLGIGVLISWAALSKRRMAELAMRWPMTDGTVISTEVIKRVSRSQDEFDTFVPRVRYEYVANGVRCGGEIIRIGLDETGYISEKQACEHVARYSAGATVSVRYDPETPKRAVLETGYVGVTSRILAGFIFIGLGVASVVFAVWIASLPTR
jgi:hypothetical protein